MSKRALTRTESLVTLDPFPQKHNGNVDKGRARYSAVDHANIPRNRSYNAHLEPISPTILAFNVCGRFCRNVIT